MWQISYLLPSPFLLNTANCKKKIPSKHLYRVVRVSPPSLVSYTVAMKKFLNVTGTWAVATDHAIFGSAYPAPLSAASLFSPSSERNESWARRERESTYCCAKRKKDPRAEESLSTLSGNINCAKSWFAGGGFLPRARGGIPPNGMRKRLLSRGRNDHLASIFLCGGTFSRQFSFSAMLVLPIQEPLV